MKKFVCSVCGYVHEGETAPEFCPICKAPKEKFVEQSAERTWAAEHVVGVAQGAPEEILQGLRENFVGECTEVGMYLAMARVAHREGFPEIGEYWRRAALEEAEHAAKFAELLEQDKLFVSDVQVKWMCLNCGQIIDATMAPAVCPVCKHPQGYFIRWEMAPFE